MQEGEKELENFAEEDLWAVDADDDGNSGGAILSGDSGEELGWGLKVIWLGFWKKR